MSLKYRRSSPSPATRTRSPGSVWATYRTSKRVIDRLRSSGKVTGTKTLMVLGSSVRTPALAPNANPAGGRSAQDQPWMKSRIPIARRS